MSTQAEIETSYDVGNDFFRLWLDEEMNYTCALYRDEEHFSDRLEDAQRAKLRFLSGLAGIHDGAASVLDIGCGWGANLAHQSLVNRVPEVHGITLSAAQHRYCRERKLPGTTVSCVDYRDYQPPRRFQAAMCICMMEHIARPEDARAGRQVALYRDFFRRVHAWTEPGSRFALQVITRHVIPRERTALEDLGHATYTIFPGGITPRLEDVVTAAEPCFEILELHARRRHYQATCAEWLRRLRREEHTVVRRFGERVFRDYERYLSTCVRAFAEHWQSLHQLALLRRDVDPAG